MYRKQSLIRRLIPWLITAIALACLVIFVFVPIYSQKEDTNANPPVISYYEGDETLPTKEYKPEHIEAGDVMLYGDNTIVIFYKSFDTEFSYTRLGKIKGGENLETMMQGEKVTVEFFK